METSFLYCKCIFKNLSWIDKQTIRKKLTSTNIDDILIDVANAILRFY
jgi:hypothetical protein